MTEALATHARQAGANRLMLAVIAENRAGLAFWQRLGFTEIRRLPDRPMGARTHTLIELARPLPPPER
ncbi:MAG TPA: GNAT family N-acetyltransferase [Paracoccaceae bacterium]|nr:GNAT family N-acetyltransferase [Paracoccaceae bacterium]